MKISRTIVMGTMSVTVVACLIGLYYNFSTLTIDMSNSSDDFETPPYFYQAFYSMSAICILFYLSLLVMSADFIRGNYRMLLPFTGVMVAEVIYFFLVGALWFHPQFGRSIAAATGVANGGLMIQFATLLPLWAPLALWAAKRNQNNTGVVV